MSATVLRADAGRLPLRDGSVDLVVTSPPYFALRSYTDGGEHYAGQIGSESIAALADNGLLTSPQASAVLDEYGQVYAGGAVLVWNLSEEPLRIFPLNDRIAAGQRGGGRVVRRRIAVVDDWVELPAVDAYEASRTDTQAT